MGKAEILDNPELVDYRAHMMNRGYSKLTIRCRSSYAGQFMRFLKGKRLDEVTPEIINQYQVSLSLDRPGEGRLSLPTQNSRMFGIKCFFRFLVGEKRIQFDPTSHVVKVHRSREVLWKLRRKTSG